MSAWQLVNAATGQIVVEHLAIAERFWGRLCGWQFRRQPPEGSGLLLVPCGSIHTLWMRFAIDVAMLDRAGKVLAIRTAVRPWRMALAPRGAYAALELPAGQAKLVAGDVVALRGSDGQRIPRKLAGFAVLP